MNPLPSFLIGAATILGIIIGAFFYGQHTEASKWKLREAEAQIASRKAITEAQEQNRKTIEKGRKDHEQAVAAINLVMSRPADRVRVPTVCAGTGNAGTTGAGSAVAEARLLSGRIEEVLGADRQRTREIIAGAELELADCRRFIELK